MQHRSRRAVLGSLLPIAVGHELSLLLVAAVALVAAAVIDPQVLHVIAAVLLLAFGIFRFVKPRAHPRWTTMRVNGRELTLWSFLMSSAHGAGLMLAPVLVGVGGAAAASAGGHDHSPLAVASSATLLTSAAGLLLHVAAMLLVMAVIAVVVYEKLGVAVLRRAWTPTSCGRGASSWRRGSHCSAERPVTLNRALPVPVLPKTVIGLAFGTSRIWLL